MFPGDSTHQVSRSAPIILYFGVIEQESTRFLLSTEEVWILVGYRSNCGEILGILSLGFE